ncbi:MAG: hypothetical protein IJM02_06660 [Clostridia bacterium]|nr:hypothetical protein [Clostridia bacterium]
MQIIKQLSKMIDEEINDAEKYINCAMKYKADRPVLAKTFYELSLSEMDHMSKLHGAVVQVIEEYRAENGEPPEAMIAIYDYLHEQQIEKSAMVKSKQQIFNS